MIDALRVREFRLFWPGFVVANVGYWMQIFGVGLLVVQLAVREERPEAAPLYLGLVGLARAAPGLGLILIAGALADRVDRRRVLLVTNTIIASNAAALAAASYFGVASLEVVLVTSFVHAAAFAFDTPTRQSMIPRIVPLAVLPSAIGLQSASFNAAAVVGPLLGGLLHIPFGMTGLLAVNALCFAAIIPPLLALRPLRPLATPALSLLRSVIEGTRYTRRRPAIAWILCVTATVAFAAGPASALLPAVAGERLVGGVSWLSLLLAAMGLGAFTGAFVTMNLRRVRSPGIIFLLSAAIHGLAIALFPFSGEPAVALFFLYVHGLAGTAVAGIAHSMLQVSTADAYRGRVMSVWGFQFVGLQPIGQFGLGVLGSLLGIHAALVVAGVVALAAGAYGAARLPTVRGWQPPPTEDIAPELARSRGIGATN